jgi:hypothetical protein
MRMRLPHTQKYEGTSKKISSGHARCMPVQLNPQSIGSQPTIYFDAYLANNIINTYPTNLQIGYGFYQIVFVLYALVLTIDIMYFNYMISYFWSNRLICDLF